MEEKESLVESLFEKVSDYGQTSYKLIRLKILDATAGVVSSLATNLAVIAAFVMFVFILSIGVAMWLGELLGKSYYGFFVVTLFYGLLGVLLMFYLKKPIKKYVSDIVVNQVLN